MVKLTMSLNLLAYGLAQLVYGPLSDRIGRRPVITWGRTGFHRVQHCLRNSLVH